MSSTRDISAELEQTTAGDRGIAVDARCKRCEGETAKRAPTEAVENGHSFRHFCPSCVRATWWTPLRRLDEIDGGRSE